MDWSPIDIDDANRWVAARVPTDRPLELVQTEPWASVFRTSTRGEPVWFKACAPAQTFEVPLTAELASRWDIVTEVVASDAARRWLLMRDAGDSLRALGNPPEGWLDILPSYAELQIGETQHVAEHLARGVPDLRVERLPSRYEELLRSELPVGDDVRASIVAFESRFVRGCDDLAASGVAPSVQHDDLHMNNVFVKEGVVRILDWGDASIGYPFFSLFETFRFLIEMHGLAPDDRWFERLRDAYLEPWGAIDLDTFELAVRIAGLARCIAWLDQRHALEAPERPAFDRDLVDLLVLAMRRAAP